MVCEICFMVALFLLSLLKKSRDILALFSYDTDRCSAVIVFFTFYQNLEKSARLRTWEFHGGLAVSYTHLLLKSISAVKIIFSSGPTILMQ